ncbi:MAG: ABC transporter permease subunit [Clostridia bacterium]
MRYQIIRTIALALTLITLTSLLAGCNGKAKPIVTEASDMNDEVYIIGVLSGAMAVNAVESALSKAKMKHYNSLSDAYLAVQQGKVDAFAFDRYLLNFAIANGLTGVKVLPGDVGAVGDVGIGISRKSDIPDLQQKINDCLVQLETDGTLDNMFQRWVLNADDTMPDVPKPEQPTMTLKVGTSGLTQPFSYYKGNELTGYDLELTARLALFLNAKLEIKVYNYDGLPSAAEAGSIDCILANLNATPERREMMDFSTPIYQTNTALLVKDEGTTAEAPNVPLETANYGVMKGSSGESYLLEHYPKAKRSTFASNADAFAALAANKVDYVLTAYTICNNAIETNSEFVIYKENMADQEIAMAVAKDNPKLLEQINGVIEKFQKDGRLDEIHHRWTDARGNYTPIDVPVAQGKNGILRLATSGEQEPFGFVLDGKLQGLDCELIERVAFELDMTVEYHTMSFDSLIAALSSGKADVICSAMAVTEERLKSVNFTIPYLNNPLSLVCRKSDLVNILPSQTAADVSRVPVEIARIGVMDASTNALYAEEHYPNAKIQSFKNYVDSTVALDAGKLDYAMMDYTSALRFIRSNRNLEIVADALTDEKLCLGISKSEPEFAKKVSAVVDKYLADGTMDEIISHWIKPDGSDYNVLETPRMDGAPKIKVAIIASREPTTFLLDGKYAGLDIELIDRVLYELGYQAEYIDMDLAAVLATVESNKAEMTLGMYSTPERAEKLLFTAPYFANPQVMLARKTGETAAATPVSSNTAGYGITSILAQDYLAGKYPSAKFFMFPAAADAMLALRSGKLDYVMASRATVGYMMKQDYTLKIVGNSLFNEACYIAVSKQQPDLRDKVDSVLSKFKADGILNELTDRWTLDGSDYYRSKEIESAEGRNGVLKVAFSPDVPPICFVQDGKPVGINVELIELIAKELDMTVEFSTMDFDALLPAIQSGKVDLAISDINATDERRKRVDFTQSYFDNPQVLVSLRDTVTDTGVPKYTAISQLSGKVVACRTGSVLDVLVGGVVRNVTFAYFNTHTDELAALQNGKVEAVPLDEPMARLAVAQNSGFAILPEQIVEDHYGIALQKDSPLTDQVNAAIAQLRTDGTLEEMKEKWTGFDDSAKTLPYFDYPGANGTLRVAHDIASEPMEYIGANGAAVGYDLELILRIGKILDRKVEFAAVDFSGLIPMLQSGKADAAVGCMSITDERKKTVDMSDSYYDGGLYFVVSKVTEGQSSVTAQQQTSFWDGLKASFTRTFLTENRWKLVLDGLGVTVLISICSGLIGSLMGFGICMLRRSKKRIAALPAAGFIRLIQGTPIVVLLMILYYIIFGKVDVSSVLVAIFGFAVNFGVYVSEMMRTGIDAVDRGQIEAANALGFTRTRTFWKITFPQAARHFLPVFKGEFISMVKMTSVVGYIAIQDLTKVSDIIRSRTLEAFFPLIATAIIYFLVANILTMLLSRLEVSLDPKRRKRTVKGVVMK